MISSGGRSNHWARKIDEKLFANDVRLTMGGEPTFVSVTNRDGLEWNFTALSPEKQAKGEMLLKRLRDRYASGALLHYGQGNGIRASPCHAGPMAVTGARTARRSGTITVSTPKPERTTRSRRRPRSTFSQKLSDRLNLDRRYVRNAYEDVYHYLFEEARLPYNVSELDAKIKNKEDRARLAKVFTKGLDSVVGHTLPVLRANWLPDRPWQSPIWKLRTERLMLIPGDSPMGYRLPLESLPWASQSDAVQIVEQDPTERRTALPTYEQYKKRMVDGRLVSSRDYPEVPIGQPDSNVVRTSICAEPRDGILHVFMPPTAYAEDYLDLVSRGGRYRRGTRTPRCASRATRRRTTSASRTSRSLPIRRDRGQSASVRQLAGIGTQHRDSVRGSAALRPRRGKVPARWSPCRHPSGGNHVILGGATPLDSPILRRPDLLRSLVGYWQNHPALSYLFSGMFLGRPAKCRVSMRRATMLSMSCSWHSARRPEFGHIPPWLVDRIYRNILTDVTGNTHPR